MTYEELKSAIEQAKTLMDEGERIAKRSLELSVGRLRRLYLPHDTLAALKRELRGYDTHKRTWR